MRVSTDTQSRLGVHDLRDVEAPPRRVSPSMARPPRSSGAPVARVRLPSVGINAQVVTGYLSSDGKEMIAPEGPYAVAWYQYSPLPGQEGNAVFSGHVDYVPSKTWNFPGGPAVFWNLRGVGPGDVVQVDLTDGTSLQYRVDFNRMYGAAAGPWAELFSPAAGDDVITLYTCDGAFSRGDYADRRVVRASRVF